MSVSQGGLSTAAPHSGSPILLCAAVLGCSAEGLAAVPSNEVCSPKSPVLFRLLPLVPGATWRSWDWAVLQPLSMPPMAAPSRTPMEILWRQRGCFSPSVSEQKHQAQFTSSSLHRAPQSPPEFTVSSDGNTRQAAGPEASPTVLHVQLNQDF